MSNGATFYLDLESIRNLFQTFRNFEALEGERQLGVFRGHDELPVLFKSVEDASRHRQAFREAYEELSRAGEGTAVVVLEDRQGNYRLGYLELLYRGRKKPLVAGRSLLIRRGHPNKTAYQRVRLLEARQGRNLDLELLREVFSIEDVSEEFYREFVALFQRLREQVQGVEAKQEFLLALVARVLFLAFVSKRGWLGEKENFLPWLLERYEKEKGKYRGFYLDWLRPLFFQALKGPPGSKGTDFAWLPEDVRKAFLQAPYLNGELFREKVGVDLEGGHLPDGAVKDLFDFLFRYNFTVEENTAYEVDLELNPEFLGLILERLVNSLGVEGMTDELGAHYTPRVEVDLMVRLALAEYLHREGFDLEKAYALFRGELEALTPEERARAKGLLLKAKILDPSVGSGAFLVGALQVLEEVLGHLGEPSTAELRKRLMANLHGVDALSWAVWMAELRLWLAYFLELPDDARNSDSPLLPSLGLKIRQGDSVVQRVGRYAVPLRMADDSRVLEKAKVKEALHRLVEAKEGYFNNLGVTEDRVREREKDFLDAYLYEKYGVGEQGLFVKTEADRFQEEREKLLSVISSKDRPFLYLVDFAEVVVGEGGFDLVIGNPPYVRQESIQDPLDRFEAREYKACLQEETENTLKEFAALRGKPPKINRRSDLYTYFYARTLALLKPKGVHVFVVSNSWLDVQYGAWLQEMFLKAAPLRYVIENQVRRSFRADVNTAISVAWAPGEKPVRPDWPVYFVAVRSPFEEADLLTELLEAQKVALGS